jgi:hypothetical protein
MGLRAPISAVSNAAAVLRTLPLDDAQRARVHSIVERQVAHASRLIDAF